MRRVLELVVVAAVLGGILGALGTVLWRHSEGHLREWVEAELEKRTGMDVRVRGLNVSARQITASDLELRDGRHEIRIATLRVHTDWKDLVGRRRSLEAVEAIEVDGVDVVLRGALRVPQVPSPSTRPEASAWMRRLAKIRDELVPGTHIHVRDLRLWADRVSGALLLRIPETALARREEQASFTGHAEIVPQGVLRWEGRLDRSSGVNGYVELVDVSVASIAPLLPRAPWYRPEEARLEGRLAFQKPRGSAVSLDGALDVRGLALSAAYLAERPIVVDTRVSGRARWDGRALEIESSRVRLGRGEAVVRGSLAWQDGRYRIDVRAAIPEQECSRVMSMVPEAVLGPFSGFEWGGRFAGDVELEVDTGNPEATRAAFDLRNGCRFERIPASTDLSRFRSRWIHHARDDRGRVHAFETGPGAHEWTHIWEVSPFLIHAVLAHEDATFFEHRGFAPFAIETALERNVAAGAMAYGASTISMQLAKNLFLPRDKTLARKAREVILTWWLETGLTKTEILELYLNVIEYGPGVYGLRRAARLYFDGTPSLLSPAESAWLACLLPSPVSKFREYEKGEPSSATKRLMADLLRHMHRRRRIDDVALSHGLRDVAGMRFPTRAAGDAGAAAFLPVKGEAR